MSLSADDFTQEAVVLTQITQLLHLHRDLAVMSGCFVVLSARSVSNSSAHKLPTMTEHVLARGDSGFFVLWLVCWLFGLFLFFLFALDCTPEWILDCVMVRARF